MTDLRQSCIEAMAERICEARDGDYPSHPDRHACSYSRYLATAALDVLLSTLTEHAAEWATETSNRYMTTAAFRADTDEEAHIHNLLAVLRGSGE